MDGNGHLSAGLRRASSRHPAAGRGGPSLLLVLPEGRERTAFAEFMGAAGYDVHAVDDPGQALAEAGGWKFAAAVADLYMPGVTGVRLAARLAEVSPNTEVILLSRWVSTGRRSKCDRQGILAVLERPFDPGLLLEVLAQARSGARLRRLACARGYLAAEPEPRRHRAMVIEGDADVRSLLCEILAGEGLRTVPLPGTAEALERLAGEDFELVVTDLLPGAHEFGADRVRLLRMADPHVAILAVTTEPGQAAAAAIRAAGARDCLAKPFDLAELRARLAALDLDAVVRRRRRRAQRHRKILAALSEGRGLPGWLEKCPGAIAGIAAQISAALRLDRRLPSGETRR